MRMFANVNIRLCSVWVCGLSAGSTIPRLALQAQRSVVPHSQSSSSTSVEAGSGGPASSGSSSGHGALHRT